MDKLIKLYLIKREMETQLENLRKFNGGTTPTENSGDGFAKYAKCDRIYRWVDRRILDVIDEIYGEEVSK